MQWSELQRDPKSVAALADAGDVRVRRRDGAPLLLTREDRMSAVGDGATAVAHALHHVLAHLPVDVAVEALSDEFPWLDLLPTHDRAEFVADFVKAARISAELGQWAVLAQTIREWKATAAVSGASQARRPGRASRPPWRMGAITDAIRRRVR